MQAANHDYWSKMLADHDNWIMTRDARRAMCVLYDGIANLEHDQRLVDVSRSELEEFRARLDRLLRRNA